MAPTYKVTYFPVKALAEPIRLIFAYTGTPYEDNRIARDTWSDQKANYPWGSLPVLEVDGKVLAQSNAILRYLGAKFNLAGENDFEAAKCDEMVEVLADLRAACMKAFMEQDETKKEEIRKSLKEETFPKYLGVWNKILTQNGGFLVGKKLSYADISLASYLQIYQDNFPWDIFEGYSAVKAHQDTVFNSKGIKEWVAKRPVTPW